MEEQKLRKDKEESQLKELTKTHFGPEEDDFTNEYQKRRTLQGKGNLDTNLKGQIGENTEKSNKRREIERREELQMLAKAGEVMIGETEENNLKDQCRKEVFRRAWKEQIDIRN